MDTNQDTFYYVTAHFTYDVDEEFDSDDGRGVTEFVLTFKVPSADLAVFYDLVEYCAGELVLVAKDVMLSSSPHEPKDFGFEVLTYFAADAHGINRYDEEPVKRDVYEFLGRLISQMTDEQKENYSYVARWYEHLTVE